MTAKRTFPRKLLQALGRMITRLYPKRLQQEFGSALCDLDVHRMRLEKWNRRLRVEIEKAHRRVTGLSHHTAHTAVAIAYLSLDFCGVIKAANAKACQMLGLPLERLLKQPLHMFVVNTDRDKLSHHIVTSWTAGREVVTKLRINGASGKIIFVQLVSQRWDALEKKFKHTEACMAEVRTALVDVADQEELSDVRNRNAEERVGIPVQG